MNWRAFAFIGIFAAQLAALGGMIYERTSLLRDGQRVLLQCEPVDPRSFLSGDYVILNYEISSFTEKEMRLFNRKAQSFEKGERVYLALKMKKNATDDDNFARPVAVAKHRADLAEFDLVLQGRARDHYTPGEYELDQARALRIKFGVEEYFVPQFEGLEIERALARTHVEVAVARSGESAIRRLFIDGQEVKFH